MSLIWTIVSFGIQLKFVSVLNEYSLPYSYSNVKEKDVVVDALKFLHSRVFFTFMSMF